MKKELFNIVDMGLVDSEVLPDDEVYKLFYIMSINSKDSIEYLNARDELVYKNRKLVISIARHYYNESISMEDLMQEGCIGLMKAVENFNYKLGYKFSTYATPWIAQAVSRAIVKQSKGIKIPFWLNDYIVKYKKVISQYKVEYGIEPDEQYIMNELNISEKKYKTIKECLDDTISYDIKISDSNNQSTMRDMLEDNHSYEEDVIKNEILKNIYDVLKDTLTEKELYIVMARLNDVESESFESIGETLNCTKQNVRGIYNRTCKKLTRNPKLRSIAREYGIKGL